MKTLKLPSFCRTAPLLSAGFISVIFAVFPLKSVYSQVALTPLELFFNPQRADNFSTATDGGRDSAASSYSYSGVEGCVFFRPQPGSVQLLSYFNAQRGDNYTTATSQGANDAIAAGYSYTRVEGYIFPTQQLNTVPLRTYYSDQREDHFTTARTTTTPVGYRFVRVEGYVYPALRCSI